MSREKVFISILTVLILTVLSGASVSAAPNGQDFIDVIVDGVQIDEGTDPATVLVTFHAEGEESQTTVRVSVDTAKDLELLQVDEDGELKFDGEGKPIPIDINPDDPPTVDILEIYVIETVDEDGAEVEHPVALALAGYFGEELDIMGAHEAGFGFGLIAQACWMSHALKGDATLFREILDDKQDGNGFEFEITLPADGTTMTTTTTIAAKNWGQFRKAVLRSEEVQIKKNLANLGAIMSKRAPSLEGTDNGDDEGELETTSTQGKVKGKKDKAGGKPPKIPPGQVKNKDKGKGGGKKQ